MLNNEFFTKIMVTAHVDKMAYLFSYCLRLISNQRGVCYRSMVSFLYYFVLPYFCKQYF